MAINKSITSEYRSVRHMSLILSNQLFRSTVDRTHEEPNEVIRRRELFRRLHNEYIKRVKAFDQASADDPSPMDDSNNTGATEGLRHEQSEEEVTNAPGYNVKNERTSDHGTNGEKSQQVKPVGKVKMVKTNSRGVSKKSKSGKRGIKRLLRGGSLNPLKSHKQKKGG